MLGRKRSKVFPASRALSRRRERPLPAGNLKSKVRAYRLFKKLLLTQNLIFRTKERKKKIAEASTLKIVLGEDHGLLITNSLLFRHRYSQVFRDGISLMLILYYIFYLLIFLFGNGNRKERKHKESKNMKDFLITMRTDAAA